MTRTPPHALRTQPLGPYAKWYCETYCLPEKHAHNLLEGLTECMAIRYARMLDADTDQDAPIASP